MSNSYQLKSHPKTLLSDHLLAVGKCAEQLIKEIYPTIVSSISLADLARAAFVIGISHDLGKGTEYFQKYLLEQTSEDPFLKSHSMISSIYCSWAIINDSKISDNHKEFLAIAASLAIQGHHGSLRRPTSYIKNQDFFDENGILEKQIESFEKIQELDDITRNFGISSFSEFKNSWQNHFWEFRKTLLRFQNVIPKFSNFYEPYYLTSVLYSVLLDADRMNAANITISREEINPDSVNQFLKEFEHNPSLEINKKRMLLFKTVETKVRRANNDIGQMYTLTAPTGLGKTLASINFALKLREKSSNSKGIVPRIIYVAPFISILDQTMDILQKIFKVDQQTSILLMHHHLAPLSFVNTELDEFKQEKFSTAQSELLIQGWNSEIIATTFIQFFNTIFGRHCSHLRRFHNLVNSIVILDEVQSIPFEYWGAVRSVLSYLTNHLKMTIILMTATQPLIFSRDETKELAPPEIMNLPSRVTFKKHNKEGIGLDEFIKQCKKIIEFNQKKSILIELNTIRTAVDVYNSLNNVDSKFFLSSQIIPKHRKPRIESIKESLGKNRIILVSTQVVEAGIDLDFDMIIRDIGPVDSIVQAAGRCNRNGIKDPSESIFFIYRIVDQNKSEFAKQVYGRIAIEIANEMILKNPKINEIVNSYHVEIQRRLADQTSDEINDSISSLNFEDVDNSFNLIKEQYKIPVFVEYDEEAAKTWESFEKLHQSEKPSRSKLIQIKHEMENYTIGVSQTDIRKSNLVETNGFFKISINDLRTYYDEETGFIRI